MIEVSWNDRNGTAHTATVPADEVDDLVASIKASGGRSIETRKVK